MNFAGVLSRFFGFTVLVAVWQTISLIYGEFFFPSPLTVFDIVGRLVVTGDFLGPTATTLARVTVGMALAILFGVMIGILTGTRRLMDGFVGPLLILFMLTPSLLIVFLSIFTFGFYDYVPSIAAAIVHTPFSAVVIRGQLLNPPRDKLEMAQAYGAKWRLIIRHIYIPYLVPAIMSEARVAYAHAWKITILAEIFGFSSGAGYMIKIYFASLDIARVLAWTLLLVAMLLVIEEAFRVFEKHVSRWRGLGR